MSDSSKAYLQTPLRSPHLTTIIIIVSYKGMLEHVQMIQFSVATHGS